MFSSIIGLFLIIFQLKWPIMSKMSIFLLIVHQVCLEKDRFNQFMIKSDNFRPVLSTNDKKYHNRRSNRVKTTFWILRNFKESLTQVWIGFLGAFKVIDWSDIFKITSWSFWNGHVTLPPKIFLQKIMTREDFLQFWAKNQHLQLLTSECPIFTSDNYFLFLPST